MLSVYAVVFVILIIANFYVLYRNIEKNMIASRENEVLKSASEMGYLMTEGLDAVKMAAYMVNSMLEEGAPKEEILSYLEQESKVYARTIDESFTGLYGVFGGSYLDGIGWVPDADYVPQERPWYQEAAAAKGKITLVSPYLDSQTHTVMMSVSKMLSDRESVISLDISLDGIQTLAEDFNAANGWAYGMVLDQNGFVVAHSDKAQLGREYLQEENTLGRKVAEKLSKHGEAHFVVRQGGKRYYVFYAGIQDAWYAVSVIEGGKFLANLSKIYVIVFLTLLFFFGVGATVFLKFRRNEAREMELSDQLRAAAGIYSSVHLINLETDSFTEVAVNTDQARALVEPYRDRAQYSLRRVMDALTDARYKTGVYAFIDFSTLGERLRGKRVVTKEFINTANIRCRARFVPVEWSEDGKLKSVLFMVELIDERNE